MSFTGFPREGFAFLTKLAKNNNREWFGKHKYEYEEFLLEPAMDLVVALGQELRKFAPGVKADPRVNGSIQRIYRDTRFSKDKTPYKTHIAMGFPFGEKRGEGVSFYMYLSAKGVGLGSGWYMFDRPTMLRYRDAVDDEKRGPALAKAVAAVKKAGMDISEAQYKRVPAPYPQDHKRAELLKHSGLYAWREFALPKETYTSKFPAWCAREMKKAKPLQDWLLEFRGKR